MSVGDGPGFTTNLKLSDRTPHRRATLVTRGSNSKKYSENTHTPRVRPKGAGPSTHMDSHMHDGPARPSDTNTAPYLPTD